MWLVVVFWGLWDLAKEREDREERKKVERGVKKRGGKEEEGKLKRGEGWMGRRGKSTMTEVITILKVFVIVQTQLPISLLLTSCPSR